jgi:hypothetical protein
VVVSYHVIATKNAWFTNSYLQRTQVFAGVLIKVPQNGEKNTKFGVYRTLCCGFEIVITEGSNFPDCPKHPKLTTNWKPVVDEVIRHASALPGARKKKKNNDPAA